MPRPYRIFVLAVLAAYAGSGFAAPPEPFRPRPRPCAVVLKKPESATAPNLIARADPSKSLMLEDFPVKDQGNYGCCWISSVLAKWERHAQAKFGEHIALSEIHMILASLFYRVEEGIYFGVEIGQGGWAESADWMATHVGLVPESACRWKVDLRDPKAGEELIGHLNYEIAKFQANLAKLKASGATEDAAWAYAQKTKAKLLKHLRDRVGNFPSSFEIDGTRYTPNSFADAIAPGDEKWSRVEIFPTEPRLPVSAQDEAEVITEAGSLYSLYPDFWRRLPATRDKTVIQNNRPARALRLYRLYGKTHEAEYKSIDLPLAAIHSTIAASLKEGQPVYLATAMVREFYRADTGIMSLAAYGGTAESAMKAKSSGGHAVLITGAYYDSDGVLLGYRIQNSWGKGSGSIGYFYMDIDYFNAFMKDIVVKKKLPPGPVR